MWPRVGKGVALFLLPVLALAGGLKAFRYAKLRLALENAHREFSQGEFIRAEFWTGRAFGVDPQNVEVARLMAEIDEAENKPAALGWRIKVAQCEPGNTGDVLAWARTALRFDQKEMAARALKSLPQEVSNRSPEYHELVGALALASGVMGLAEAHFITASQLDHDNPAYKANLAAFRLAHSSRPEVRTAAARDLEGMLTDSRVSLFATRALLEDAIRSRDSARAQRFAHTLGALPGHDFNDDLRCLAAALPEPGFHAALEGIEARAGSGRHVERSNGRLAERAWNGRGNAAMVWAPACRNPVEYSGADDRG